MAISPLFIIGAALCAIWSVVTITLITVDLDKTIEASEKIGWLYYSFFTTINGAWIRAALALAP